MNALFDTLREILRGAGRRESRESFAVLRATRRVTEAVERGESIPHDAARTIERVIRPGVSWEDLIRAPRR